MEKSAIALRMTNGTGQFIKDYMFPRSKEDTVSTISEQLGAYREIKELSLIHIFAFKEALLETVAFPNSITTVGAQPFRNNKGKDGSHVVEVTTTNKEHRKLTDDTYVINYTGKIGLDEVEDKVTVEFDKADYTGKEIKPTVTIEGLKEGTDFEVSYTDNVELGVGHVIIKGIGKYEGTLNKTFKIVASDKANVVVKPSAPSTKADDFDKDSIKTVSYTHLDVYKRQGGAGAGVFSELPELPALLLDEAVSETEFSEPFFSEDFSFLPSLSESFCARCV